MAGGEQIGGDADCAVFIGAVGGGDCGGGEGVVISHVEKLLKRQRSEIDYIKSLKSTAITIAR